jgi:endogenous inhibitor of DNA gyrase (YacG/DUF329 family)
MTATQPCPWCGAGVVVQKRGSHAKRFCNDQHRNAYNAKQAKLARWYGAVLSIPGALRDTPVPPYTARTEAAPVLEAAE